MNGWINHFKFAKKSIYDQCCGKSKRMLNELIIQNTPKGGRILEVGCGTAILSLVLADYGFEVTALDVSEEILDYARSRLALIKTNMKLVQGDMLKLSFQFEEKYFDTVCHSGVMEHFDDGDIILSLSEQRIISKRTIFNVPNIRSKMSEKYFGDERFLSNRKWVNLIKEAGFKNVKIFGGYDVPFCTYFILPGIFLHRRFSFWWKWFSRHSVFLCE